ncbi:hypothetical protein SUGI_0972730 [Cryptomeria japonica]|uniref:uncharacterized protein LOC131073857 n=1 Tax=Cryptomeria japonica TaxID=3369 RepID=UPI002414CE1B|nr:uncharacterized protein LOC131073857 [Cryptomeria japonica]GLJ46180.1 hypothetical protein SUGI_0972730 [Cryptomeria japonica]
MEDGSEKLQNVPSWDCGSPLYDSYELASIINQLDRGLATLYPSSRPPPDRQSCYTSWISSKSQKIKRASGKYTCRFCIISSGNVVDARKRVNRKHPLGWLFRLPWIVSQGVKSIPFWKVAVGDCPSQKQITDDRNGGQTSEGSNSNGKL